MLNEYAIFYLEKTAAPGVGARALGFLRNVGKAGLATGAVGAPVTAAYHYSNRNDPTDITPAFDSLRQQQAGRIQGLQGGLQRNDLEAQTLAAHHRAVREKLMEQLSATPQRNAQEYGGLEGEFQSPVTSSLGHGLATGAKAGMAGAGLYGGFKIGRKFLGG